MTTIFDSGSWISSVWSAGTTATEGSGIMGALQGSKKYPLGSAKALLANNANNALAMATIAQIGVTDLTTLAIQAGDLAMQKRAQERAALLAKGASIPPAPLMDSVVYFENGSTLDTIKNVLTLVNGKKIDAITGANWVDPASIINLANGSYLDTANNILTLADGTRVDAITGLTIAVTA